MKRKETILVVDDEPPVRQVLSTLLETEGFAVIEAADGTECLRVAHDYRPDLVLLDIMMPHRDGREVCQRLREISNVPIIMLTALPGGKETVERLQDGADDYITKPFRNDELVARIRAVLRRTHRTADFPSRIYEDNVLKVDFAARQLLVNGKDVSLSPKQWRLLECLVNHKDRAVTHATLLRYGWGEGYEDSLQYLKVFISQLRHRLDDNPRKPRYIHTERELGYRFESHA
jgi:two-component system KDP operon response regulator KdpE